MSESEREMREKIVRIAREWIGTPYFPCEARKGRGCDCGSFLAGVGLEAGIIPRLELGHYNWMKAWAREGGDADYLALIEKFARPIDEGNVQPGDVVMYHVGKGWAHSGIIVRWPGEIIHAQRTIGVSAGPGNSGFLAGRPRRFWTLF